MEGAYIAAFDRVSVNYCKIEVPTFNMQAS